MKEDRLNIYAKYLEGTAGKAELKLVREWLEDENIRMELKELEALWHAGAFISSEEKFNTSEGWKNLQQQISGVKGLTRFRKKYLMPLLKVAAIVLISFAVSFLLFEYLNDEKVQEMANVNIEVPLGSKSQMILPDGTKVWLNAGTKLSFPSQFDPEERMVNIEGEAFFQVQSDAERPFIVVASELRIKAVGTAFNVKSYPDEQTIEATLVEGKVLIERNISRPQRGGSIDLLPNQKVIYNKEDHQARKVNLVEKIEKALGNEAISSATKLKMSESIESTEENTSWKDNRLVFRSERFDDLARRMERWYNVSITIKTESLKRKSFNGVFEKESVEQALEALKLAARFDYTIKENHITITAN